MAKQSPERRRYERVTILQPLRGRVADARVFINDVSVNGIRVAHQGNLPRPGNRISIEFEWEGQRLEFACEVVHNELQRLGKSAAEKSVYLAGLHIVGATADSAVLLRKIVTEHVERALDEQRANARGIPAVAAHAYQTGKTKDFVRCQLVNDEWRRTTTTRPDQPENGFTISAAEEHQQIDMLCEAYARGDEGTRRLIRSMAQLSTATADGVATRRYTP